MPRRSRIRWLFWPAAALVAAVAVLRSDAASDLACRAVEATIEGLSGERATVGGLSFGPGGVSVLGIDVAHPATNDTIVHADAVTLALGWDENAGPLPGIGAPVLRTLALVRPKVHLHLDADGLREFRNTTTIFSGSGASQPLTRFPWEELRVVSGSLHVDGPSTDAGPGWTVMVDGIDLTPSSASLADLTLGDVRVTAGDLDLHEAPVIFRQIALTPERVTLPTIQIGLRPGSDPRNLPIATLAGNLDAWLGHTLTGDLSLLVQLPGLTPGLPDWNRPAEGWTDGILAVDTTLAGTPADPQISGELALDGLTLHLGVPRKFGDLHGPWRLDLAGPVPHALIEGAEMTWGPGNVSVDANINLGDATIGATVRAESVSLASILSDVGVAPTPWVNFSADVETNVTGSIVPFRLVGPFEIDLQKLEVGDAPVWKQHDTLLAVSGGSLVGDLVITPEHMVLDARQLRAGPTYGHVVADIGFLDDGPLHVDVDLPNLDLSWLAPLNDLELGGTAAVKGVLEGPYSHLTAEGAVVAKGLRVFDLALADTLTAAFSSDMQRLDFDGIAATVGATNYTGHFGIDLMHDERIDTDLHIVDGHARDLTGIFVDLGNFDAALTGDITLDGTPYNLNGPAHLQLGAGTLWGEPTTGGELYGAMVDGEFRLDKLRMTRPHGESVSARGSVKRGFAMNLEILSDGLAIERLAHAAGLGVNGDAVLDAQVGGTLYDWEPRGRIALRHVSVFGEPIADTTFRFQTTHRATGAPVTDPLDTLAWTGDLLGGAGAVDGTLGLHDEQPYALHAKFTDFPFAFFHPRAPDGTPISAKLTGTLDLAGQLGDHPTQVDIDGSLANVALSWGEHQLKNEAAWAFSLHGGAFDVPPVTLIGNDGTRVTFAGRAAPASAASDSKLPPVLFEGSGKVNLDLLRAVVPELAESRGLADLTLRIDSTAVESVNIAAKIRNASFRSGYFPATFESLSADIAANARGYTLTNVKANVGGGTFVGAPSTIAAVDWVPSRYSLSGKLADSKLQYLDYLPPMRGDADLTFDGPVDALLLHGEIHILDMEWKDRIDWESEVVSLRQQRLTAAAPDPNSNYFGMDLAVCSGSAPCSDATRETTLKLRNNVADADASCNLTIVGDTSRPGMVGEINLAPGGRMYLNDREFEIFRGEIRYIDPYTFDPDLDILLETDIHSSDQDYHINYMVNGPFSDWRTTTSSDPYQSQADINALLLFGVTREELERTGGLGTALLAETGDLLLGQTPLSRANIFVVDRWNLVSGVTERGTPTVSSDLRLVAQKELGGFEVTMETGLTQNVGREWYLSVERRIAQRLYASTWLSTEQEGRSLPVGAAAGLDLKLRVEGN